MDIQQAKLKFAYDHNNDLITDKLLLLGVRESIEFYMSDEYLPDCKWIFLWEGVFSYYFDDVPDEADWKSECKLMTLDELNKLI